MTIRRALVPVVLLACVALATSCAHTTPPVCPESETRHWEVAPEWLQGRVDPPGIEARWRSEVGFAAMREDDQRLLLSLFRRNLAAFSEKLHPGVLVADHVAVQGEPDRLGRPRRSGPAEVATHALVLRAPDEHRVGPAVRVAVAADHVAEPRVVRVPAAVEEPLVGRHQVIPRVHARAPPRRQGTAQSGSARPG